MSNEKYSSWFPPMDEYTPNISVSEWLKLLQNGDIFNESCIEIMERFLDCSGQATCMELAEKYGKSFHYYSGNCSALAKRIHKATNCRLFRDNDGEKNWWSILFVGKYAEKEQSGVWIWKLREELESALKLYNEFDRDITDFTNQPAIWKISHGTNAHGIPEHLRKSFEEQKIVVVSQDTLRLSSQKYPQGQAFMQEIQKGDYFYLCYASEIVLFGQFVDEEPKLCREMLQEYEDDTWYERKYRLIANSNDHSRYTGKKKLWTSNYNSTCVKVMDNQLFEELILKPYFDLTLSDLGTAELPEPYTRENFLNQVYMESEQYDRLSALLMLQKNVILQGTLGVGKTFTAKRLAYSIMGEMDDSKIEFVQFHQSYSYEDFMMGYRPNANGGFDLKEGVFYRFCKKAEKDAKHWYFFIIDEINRGNVSRIFGELLMLIEPDKRGNAGYSVQLSYRDEKFSVPENVCLIGMMNTADRSLAMIDYALRRRFSFFEMHPQFESEGFRKYQESLHSEKFNALIKEILQLNEAIRKDPSLGKSFLIGHSYFCNLTPKKCTLERLRSIIDYQIIPTLQEYWFDDEEKAENWKNRLNQGLGVTDDK